MMITEQEVQVRAAAIQAASSVAATVGMGDPAGVLKVAGMMEVYINQGAEAAQKVIDSWAADQPAPQAAVEASPQETHVAPNGDSPTVARPQELAEEAYRATDRAQLKKVIDTVKAEGLGDSMITIADKEGQLSTFLNGRWAQLAPKNDTSSIPLHERNKSTREQAIASMRSDLGL